MREQRRLAAIAPVNFSAKSVVGHSRRFEHPSIMSGLSPTADVSRPGQHFAFVPNPEVGPGCD